MYIRMLVPAVISAIAFAASDMVDAIVVGQSMGEVGLTAIAMCLPVYSIMNIFIVSLSTGGSISYAYSLSNGRQDEAKKHFSLVISAGLTVGIILAGLGLVFSRQAISFLGASFENKELFSAVSDYYTIITAGIPLFFISFITNAFLRNDDNEKLATVGFSTGCAVDFGLNIIFVILMHMGSGGAALATIAGQLIAISIYLLGIFNKKYKKSLGLCKFKLDFSFLIKTFSKGFSTAIQYICSLVFLSVINHILLDKGGEAYVAVFDVLYSTTFLVTYLFNAAGNAMQPLATTYYGEHNVKEENKTLKFAVFSGCVLGGIVVALIEIRPSIFCNLFGLYSADTISIGIPALRIYAVSLFISGISILYATYYQAVGEVKKSFVITLLRTGVLLIPMILIFSIQPIKYFWYSFVLVEAITFVIAILLRLHDKKVPRYDPERTLSRTIENNQDELSKLLKDTEEFCERWGADPKQSYLMYSAVEEVCVIIMDKAMKDKDGFIQLTMIALNNGDVELHVRDTADEFNPFALQTQKASSDGDFDVSTMGILVLKKKAKDFYYRQFKGFNVLVIRV